MAAPRGALCEGRRGQPRAELCGGTGCGHRVTAAGGGAGRGEALSGDGARRSRAGGLVLPAGVGKAAGMKSPPARRRGREEAPRAELAVLGWELSAGCAASYTGVRGEYRLTEP